MTETRKLDIAKVLQYVRDEGYLPDLARISQGGYDLGNALETITALGRMRNPRFVIDEENRFAYENFVKWCHADPSMRAIDPVSGEIVRGDIFRGIYIAGNTGTGKSWCLELLQVYAKLWGFQVQFSKGGTRQLSWSITRADEICEHYQSKGEIASFKQAKILGIQDLGQEPPETLYMGNRQNVLGQLLEYRGDVSDQLTLITSNLKLSGEKLNAIYGDRVQSRLTEMCNYFEIKGKDRRKIR